MANIGYLPRQDFAVEGTSPADILIRSVLIAVVFLALWFSFHPFPALDEPIEVTEAGNLANQLGYSTLFVLLATWNLFHQPQRLLLLVRPVLIVTLLWFALTVATSWDPAQSARRFTFALVIIGIAGMVLLLPKTPRHFAGVMAVVVLIVYSTMNMAAHRVEVCMQFEGRTNCRTASGSTRDFALRTAMQNACAEIASGVTDSIKCEHEEPVKLNWLK